jgi:hypothetical protein
MYQGLFFLGCFQKHLDAKVRHISPATLQTSYMFSPKHVHRHASFEKEMRLGCNLTHSGISQKLAMQQTKVSGLAWLDGV